jgi:beta-galactosidase
MAKNGHIEWKVKYKPGILSAIGYQNGKKIITEMVKTTSLPDAVQLSTQQKTIKANKEDIAVVTVAVHDKGKLLVPTANNEITFSIKGPGKIIGVGNGNQTSVEPDQYLDSILMIQIGNLKEKAVTDFNRTEETASDLNDKDWKTAFTDERNEKFGKSVKALVYRGSFALPDNYKDAKITLFYKNIGMEQSIYINGSSITPIFKTSNKDGYLLNSNDLHIGVNNIAIVATPLLKKYEWDKVNQDPGLIQMIFPAAPWKRKLFNGLAQVIVQSTGAKGKIELSATTEGIKPTSIIIDAQ